MLVEDCDILERLHKILEPALGLQAPPLTREALTLAAARSVADNAPSSLVEQIRQHHGLQARVVGCLRELGLYDAAVADAVRDFFARETEACAAAHEAQTQVDAILESVGDAFFAVDGDWTILRMNRQHEKTSQIAREQQIGANFLSLFLSNPGAEQSQYWKQYHKSMRERVPVYFEDFYAPLHLWTSVNTYVMPDGSMAVFYRDITAQKLANQAVNDERQKLEAIFLDASAGMAILRGPSFIFERVNAPWEGLVGPRSYIGKTWREAYAEVDAASLLAQMAHVYETGEPFVINEVKIRVDGTSGVSEERYYDYSYVRIVDSAGRPYGIYSQTLDVTERVRARLDVEHSEHQLKNAVEARDVFLGIASHELKTPLNSWKLQVQMYQRRLAKKGPDVFTPETLAQVFDSSTIQVDRLIRLVDDMLDVSRIASGNLSMVFGLVDVSALVRSGVERFAPLLNGVGCDVTVDVEAGIVTQADAGRLEQVLDNLLTNAVKYAPRAPVGIRLSRTAGIITLSVQDHGPGIAPNLRAQVFERFERLVSASDVSGLGLGLPIVREIVRAHGGDVRIQASDQNARGCTFVVAWPQKMPA